jgi:signal transduction histidine kinase
MQATQSSTAFGPRVVSGKFVALRHVTRQMNLNNAAMPVVRRAAPAAGDATAVAGVAEGARLQVEGDEPRRWVVMTVRDRGCGMDQAAVRMLMQTGGISTANGRGMGFRVVRELVAISGGSLNIESQPEVGTNFSGGAVCGWQE